MSEALMMLPAANLAAPATPPAQAGGSGAQADASAARAAGRVDKVLPKEAKLPDANGDGKETAAQFSEVLASVVSSFAPVHNQPVEWPVEEISIDLPVTESVGVEVLGEDAARGFWNFVQAPGEEIPVDGDVALPLADQLVTQAAKALKTSELPTPLASENAIAFDEALKGVLEPAMVDVKADPKLTMPVPTDASQATVQTTGEGAAETLTVQPQPLPNAPDSKLPVEAKVMADNAVDPSGPQAAREPAASSVRVVQSSAGQAMEDTNDAGEGNDNQIRGTKSAAVHGVRQSEQTQTETPKVAASGADKMTEGQFTALRPEPSAPVRSVAERQALPEKKADAVGKDFSETQRVIPPPATETTAAENVSKTSETKSTSTATPAEQVADAARSAQRTGLRVLELELKPEGLGTLRLKLTGPARGPEGQGQHIEIQALNPKAHALLLDHLTELRSALGQWEIRLMPPVTSQDFGGVMAGAESRGNGQTGSQRQSGQGQPHRDSSRGQSEEDFAEQFRSSTNA